MVLIPWFSDPEAEIMREPTTIAVSPARMQTGAQSLPNHVRYSTNKTLQGVLYFIILSQNTIYDNTMFRND